MYLNHVRLRVIPWLVVAALIGALTLVAWSVRAGPGQKSVLSITPDEVRLELRPCPAHQGRLVSQIDDIVK